MQNFQVLKKLGDGAFSSVHQVKRTSDGSLYAMKKVKMGKLSEKEKQNAVNEIRILASINHPNVIAYKEAFFENSTNSLCIVMEMADNGDLLQAIEKHKKQRSKFTEKQIWHYFVQIVRGLKTLHDLTIVHRDIKCANIFLTKDGMVKLGDLNVSKVAKKGMMHTQTGTPYYASPEVWMDKPYDFRSDIWSLGCVLYEMITLLPPFRATSMQALSQKVVRGIYDPIPSHFSIDLTQMVRSTIQVTPKNRPSCAKILAQPGLLNHLTGTLENIDVSPDRQSNSEILLSTIRCPKNLGMITDKLPRAQYSPLKKSKSTELESIKAISLKEVVKLQVQPKLAERAQRRVRELGNLPTIEESNVDEDIVEVEKKLERQIQKKRIMARNASQVYSERQSARNDPPLSSARVVSKQIPMQRNHNVAKSYERPPLNIQPRSADLYLLKKKAHNKLGQQIVSRLSNDNDDASTQVSSSYIRQLNNYGHDSRTPLGTRGIKIANLLPSLHQRNISYVSEMDPPFSQYDFQQPQNTRHNLHNMKNAESVGMASAMGGNPRYAGVSNAIKYARHESKENLHHQQESYMRGPCPNRYMNKAPSIPSFMLESDSEHQIVQDINRGLGAVSSRKRVGARQYYSQVEVDYVHQPAGYQKALQAYNY